MKKIDFKRVKNGDLRLKMVFCSDGMPSKLQSFKAEKLSIICKLVPRVENDLKILSRVQK